MVMYMYLYIHDMSKSSPVKEMGVSDCINKRKRIEQLILH